MSESQFLINSLHPSIRSTAKTLLPFWENEGWYNSDIEMFNLEKIIEIINEIPTLESSENLEKLDIYFSTIDVLIRSNINLKNEIKISGDSFYDSVKYKFKKTLDMDNNVNFFENNLSNKKPFLFLSRSLRTDFIENHCF